MGFSAFGRHSVAAYLHENLGYDIICTICDVVGYANVRVKQAYMGGFDYSTADEAMEQVDLSGD